MLTLQGDKDFGLPLVEVWAKLTDARFLITCIPDVERVDRAEKDEAALVIRPGLAFVRGSLDVTVNILDKMEPSSFLARLVSRGIGSSSTVEVRLNLNAMDPGTHLHWVAEVTQLGGLLKMVPSGLLQGAAQKVIGDIWNNVEARLAAS
jgi:carbon monoxide dehydrogenase subunit G